MEEATQGTELKAKRFILMRHDPRAVDMETGNKRYLYPTAEVVATVGSGLELDKAGVDVVQITVLYREDGQLTGLAAHNEAFRQVNYLADYQLKRLMSGSEDRSKDIYHTWTQAMEAAERVFNSLKGLL